MSGDRRVLFGRMMIIGTAWIVLAYLVIPMVIVIPVSLTDSDYLLLPDKGLSLQYYERYFSSEKWLWSTYQSFVIALVSSCLSMIFGTLCAIGCWRISTRLAEVVRVLMLVPIIVPTIVQALAMYRFWIQLGLIDTYAGIILAHTLVGIPYVVVTVSASLANFDIRLEQAARNLGASLSQTIRWLIIPRVLPGIAAGGIFAFALSFDEIVIALFLTSRKVYTLPKRIWDGIQDNLDPTIAAVATLLIAATLAILIVKLLLDRNKQTEARST